MSTVSGRDWAAAARQQREDLLQARAYTEELARRHAARREEVAAQANHALAELTSILLPRLEPEFLSRAAHLTGYQPLVTQPLVQAMHAERLQLEATIARVEADPLFANREFLRDPRGGKLVLEMMELHDARQSVRAVLQACAHPRMPHLLHVGYGTSAYDVPFWRLSYYTDWEAGDAILLAFPGKTFAEVRDEYLRAAEADSSLAARLAELDGQLAQGARLDREHAQATEALRTLEARHVYTARAHLGRHMVDAGGPAIGPRLAAEPELDILAKRVFGLGSKVSYLDGLQQHQLTKMHAEIQEGIARNNREILKYERPKNAYLSLPRDKFDQRFRSRRERYAKGWQRYQRASDTVYVFDRYDRGSFAQDFLWWDLMTDGRIDGDFLPDVAHHHHRYPHAASTESHGADDDARDFDAASAVDPEPDAGGSAGFLDPS